MNDRNLLGPWIRRFLLEYLVGERNLARNTQTSYRDTLTLLLPFASKRTGIAIDRMTVEDLSPANEIDIAPGPPAISVLALSILWLASSGCARRCTCRGVRRCDWSHSKKQTRT
jgi:hypothetical protein